MSAGDARFDAAAIEAFLTAAFVALGVPRGDARAVAGLMVKADLYGHGSHGTFRLRQYVNRLRDGGTNPRARVTVAVEHAATALVDGDNGLGHLAMLYVTMAADEDMVGIYGAVGSANHVPPFGGMDLLLGTNPIAVAVPAGHAPPFVLDMATTVAAAGKIKALAQQGGTMPEGWMVARDGTPLTDPARHKEGFLLPIGGAKGYGLAMAIGLLAGTLNGAAFGKDVVEFSEDTVTPTNTGQLIAAIRVAAFADVDVFKAAVDEVLAQMVASQTLPGHDRVRIPGDRRGAIYAERMANGVPLNPALVETLAEIALELNIPKLA